MSLSEGEHNQAVFALQCKLIVDSYEMLRDFGNGSYKVMADQARSALMGANVPFTMTPMPKIIRANFAPIFRGSPVPWRDVMTKDWQKLVSEQSGEW